MIVETFSIRAVQLLSLNGKNRPASLSGMIYNLR